MGKEKSTTIVSAFLLFLSSNLSLLTCHGQLLPLVDDHGGSPKQIQTYIVHVLHPRADELLGDAEREEWHRSFLPNTTLDSGEPRLVYSYRDAISGFAARLAPDEVRAMESIDGFLHAHPDKKVAPMTTYTPRFLGLNKANGLWPDSFLGQGIIIGVIDTGITPNHPSFRDDGTMPPAPSKWKGGCGFCNNKLIGAAGFYHGRRTSPRDRNGHGTHVAGTAVGNFVDKADVLGQAKGRASGTAPRAHIASYKCLNGTTADCLKAIDQAIYDGVDIISGSIGYKNVTGTRPFYEDDLVIAALSAARKGIFPCFAAGNSGPYRSLMDNTAPWIMTVGASSTDRRIRAIVRLGNGTEVEGETADQPSNFTSTYWPLDFPGFKGRPGGYGCKNDSFDNVDIKGKIIMCPFGNIESVEKGKNVNKAGGAAMILLNSFVQGSTTFSDVHVLPTVQVNSSGAKMIVSYLKSDPNPTATIVFNGTKFGARPSPAVAYFSSRGPSLVNGGILKPDILGPGVNILSAWPFKIGKKRFNFLSGTSMATPHLSGVVALLKSTHPSWSPAAIKSAIMTTADRLDLDGKPIVEEYEGLGTAANLFTMGAGQVNPLAANDPGLVYDLLPSKYTNYLCGMGFTDEQVQNVTRRQFKCSNFPGISAEQLNYPSISVSLGSSSNKTITRQVTNVGEANEVYKVDYEEPNGVSLIVTPAELRFTNIDQKKRYSVEFRIKGIPPSKGDVSEGQLKWISNKHYVRSPISVTF